MRAAFSSGGVSANNLISYADGISVEMSETNKQQPSDQNKKQASSNVQGVLPGVLTKKRSKRAEHKRRPKGKTPPKHKHILVSHAEIKAKLEATASRQKSLFLGNGFNIAIGVRTSYTSLRNSLLRHKTIVELFKDKKLDAQLYNKIKRNAARTEWLISRIKDPYHRAYVKEIFYNRILQRAKTRYDYKEVVRFLSLFKLFFTTNYDPLLYLLLLSMIKGDSLEDRDYYSRVEQINAGYVRAEGDEAITRLRKYTKRQLYDFSTRIIKKEEGFADKKMEDFYRVLKDIRKEPTITLRDGFGWRGLQGEDPQWDDLLGTIDKGSANLFYLHGSTFFYKDNGTIRKKTSGRKSGFLKSLTSSNGPMCVFAADSRGKKRQIKGNDYLEHCQDRLREIKDDLCIVGWSCGKCDKHLIECINENKEITRLLISCYGRSDGEKIKRANEYKKIFKDKETIFWDVSTAPFYKEPRKKRAGKK